MPNQDRLSRRQLLAASTGTLLAAPRVAPNELLARQTPVASPDASPVASGPQLHISATEVQFDEAFEIGVTGLNPGDEVTIRSDFTDLGRRHWSAEATWQADSFGNIWCSGFPPVSGTFDVADSMAFIWAASAGDTTFYTESTVAPEPVMITARLHGDEIGSETIERTILENWDSISTPVTPDLVAQFYAPAAGFPTPAPAIVVLGGSDGGLAPYSLHTAALLASHGYATLVVAYFGDFGAIGSLPPTLENVPLEYFANAIAWLQEQPIVDPSRLGVLGFSRGGELALLLGAYYPEFSAVVSYVGSGYVTAGFNPADPYAENPQPAWTWGGEAVPAYPSWTWNDELVPSYASTPVPTPDELEAAEIPVEQINGPVLLIAGESDGVWDSSSLSQVAWERLRRKEHPWPSQFLNYPGADHSIGAPYMPMAFEGGGFGTPLSNQIASVNSWAAVLNMFEWQLRQGS